MGEQEIIVLGNWGSPYSKRVEIALKLKGVSYDYKEQEPYQKKSPELVKSNPVYKKIPVLIHNGQPVAESQVIMEYIDEVWKGYPILPHDSYQRTRARFWAKFIDDKVYIARKKHTPIEINEVREQWTKFFRCLPSIWNALWATNDEQEKAVKEAKENLDILEKEIEGKKFFGGEKIGFVDIVANFIGFWLECIQEALGKEIMTKERYPYLCKWAEEFVRCDIIMQNLPPRDRLITYFNIRNEAAKTSK